MVDFGRVQKELQECSRDMEASGIKVTPVSDNLVHLKGTIPGPVGTPYEGGTFHLDIKLPDGYPFEPPKMHFVTKVWKFSRQQEEVASSALLGLIKLCS